MSTNTAQAERSTPRQPAQPTGAQRPASQTERPSQSAESGRRAESESSRSQQAGQGSERTGAEASVAQNGESTASDDAASSGQSAGTVDEVTINEPEYDGAEIQVMAELAALFGIEPAALEVIMENLGFTKADLLDPANRTVLLQAVFGLESEVQLLNIPDVAKIHQEIAKILEQYPELQHVVKAPQPETAHAATQTQAVSESLPQAPIVAPKQAAAEGEPIVQEQPIVEPQQEKTPRADAGSNLGQESREHHQDGQLSHTAQQKPAEEPRLEVVQQSDGTCVVTEASTNQAARIVSVSSRPAPVSVNAQDIIRQLADNMRFDIRGTNVSEIRLTLRPENLGEVTMKIAAENGIVTASFVAENTRVKEAIEANMNQLRQALGEKGIEVSELSVSVESNADERMRQFLAEQARSSGKLREITQGLDDEAEALEAEQAERLTNLDSTVEFRA